MVMAVRPRPTATINAPRWAAGPGRCVFYFAPRLGRSDETYGAFGAAATLLIWLYVISRLITSAAFLNATLWSRRNERAGQANPSL